MIAAAIRAGKALLPRLPVMDSNPPPAAARARCHDTAEPQSRLNRGAWRMMKGTLKISLLRVVAACATIQLMSRTSCDAGPSPPQNGEQDFSFFWDKLRWERISKRVSAFVQVDDKNVDYNQILRDNTQFVVSAGELPDSRRAKLILQAATFLKLRLTPEFSQEYCQWRLEMGSELHDLTYLRGQGLRTEKWRDWTGEEWHDGISVQEVFSVLTLVRFRQERSPPVGIASVPEGLHCEVWCMKSGQDASGGDFEHAQLGRSFWCGKAVTIVLGWFQHSPTAEAVAAEFGTVTFAQWGVCVMYQDASITPWAIRFFWDPKREQWIPCGLYATNNVRGRVLPCW